jgi:hypothetical protein
VVCGLKANNLLKDLKLDQIINKLDGFMTVAHLPIFGENTDMVVTCDAVENTYLGIIQRQGLFDFYPEILPNPEVYP